MGDPAGVGPEVVVATMAQMSNLERESVLVIGNLNILEKAKKLLNLDLHFDRDSEHQNGHVAVLHVPTKNDHQIIDCEISGAAGEAAYQYVAKAVDMATKQNIGAIVTAPLSKEAMHIAGRNYDGHTGLLTHLTRAKEAFMLLSGGKLSTIHVTTHMSLLDAANGIRSSRVLSTINAADKHFKSIGMKSPRIAVAGLNPHCGEGGAFGMEERNYITPAIKAARAAGIEVTGPISGDIVFLKALQGEFDVVVAQYHDQGHIPTKLVSFEETVNITLGLPIIRTSVDHGTAFDLAWKGRAKNKNLNAAVAYARKLVSLSQQEMVL